MFMYDVNVCLCVTISLFDASPLDGLLLPLAPGPRLHGPGSIASLAQAKLVFK